MNRIALSEILKGLGCSVDCSGTGHRVRVGAYLRRQSVLVDTDLRRCLARRGLPSCYERGPCNLTLRIRGHSVRWTLLAKWRGRRRLSVYISRGREALRVRGSRTAICSDWPMDGTAMVHGVGVRGDSRPPSNYVPRIFAPFWARFQCILAHQPLDPVKAPDQPFFEDIMPDPALAKGSIGGLEARIDCRDVLRIKDRPVTERAVQTCMRA